MSSTKLATTGGDDVAAQVIMVIALGAIAAGLIALNIKVRNDKRNDY